LVKGQLVTDEIVIGLIKEKITGSAGGGSSSSARSTSASAPARESVCAPGCRVTVARRWSTAAATLA
jgi:hypothetical protein